MTTMVMIFWIAVTTLYGIIMHNRGHQAAVQEMSRLLVDAKIVKSLSSLQSKIEAYYDSLDEEET